MSKEKTAIEKALDSTESLIKTASDFLHKHADLEHRIFYAVFDPEGKINHLSIGTSILDSIGHVWSSYGRFAKEFEPHGYTVRPIKITEVKDE